MYVQMCCYLGGIIVVTPFVLGEHMSAEESYPRIAPSYVILLVVSK
jgi:hypothetical protein